MKKAYVVANIGLMLSGTAFLLVLIGVATGHGRDIDKAVMVLLVMALVMLIISVVINMRSGDRGR